MQAPPSTNNHDTPGIVRSAIAAASRTNDPNNRAADALQYAKAGLAVFPLCWVVGMPGKLIAACPANTSCESPGKHPLYELAPNGHHSATTDEATIRAWWAKYPHANIGLVVPGDLVVLDIDPRNGGDGTWASITADYPELASTVSASTGGGGWHFYYRVSSARRVIPLGAGVDVKYGGRGYVVAPPSRHLSGERYQWVEGASIFDREPGPLPEGLLEPEKTASSAALPKHAPSERYLAAAVENGAAAIATAPEGMRNNLLNKEAYAIGGLLADVPDTEREAVIEVLTEAGIESGLPRREAERTAEAGVRAGTTKPRQVPPKATGTPKASAAEPLEPYEGTLDDLLTRVREMVTKFIVVTEDQATAVSLWILHTYVFDAFDITPYLYIRSVEKASGKTRLLEVLEQLVSKPRMMSHTSPAAMFRLIEVEKPTVLFDEVDATFAGDRDTREALRGILNSGYERGGCTWRVVGKSGTDLAARDFQTFCPKALAGLGQIPDTIESRSITILLKRKHRGELVAPARRRDLEACGEPIRHDLAAWSVDVLPLLEDALPDVPPELPDRPADCWAPLLAIADLAGGDWPAMARRAAIALTTGKPIEDDSNGVRLLASVLKLFDQTDKDIIMSTDLVAKLVDDEEAPWAEFRKGNPLTATTLAGMLKHYDITPKVRRLGEKTIRSYERHDFIDAWLRYLPPSDALSRNTRNNDGEQVTA